MRHWSASRQAGFAGVLVVLVCLALLPGVPAPLRMVAGIVLVLAAPGAAAVHAARLVDHVPRPVVWVLVPAASVVLTILLVLVLHLLRIEITRGSVAAGLLVTTAGLVAAGELRRPRRAAEPGVSSLAPRPGRPPARAAALLGLAGVLMLGAVVVAGVGEQRAAQQVAFSQLWLLPTEEPGEVVVGVRSAEATEQEFRLEVAVGGSSPATYSWAVHLQPGESWERPMAVPAGAFTEAQLLRPGDQSPYRQVHLTTTASPTGPAGGG